MAAPSLATELIALLEPLAEANGLELVTVEAAGAARHSIVRVFLDREGGIDIDAITDANGWVSAALDRVSRLKGPYTLEVSSPGIERVLRTRRDFERFAGSRAVLQAAPAVEGRTKFTGDLAGMDGDDVLIVIEGHEHRVPFSSVERARLKADFSELGEGSGNRT